jgi:hypothetical protein
MDSIALFKSSKTNAVECLHLTLRAHDERILHSQSNSCRDEFDHFRNIDALLAQVRTRIVFLPARHHNLPQYS